MYIKRENKMDDWSTETRLTKIYRHYGRRGYYYFILLVHFVNNVTNF